MIFSRRFQIFTLLIVDIAIFYLSLVLTLIIRYILKIPFGSNLGYSFTQIWLLHKWPFFYVHIFWILVFYINSLYDIRSFPSPKILLSKTLKTMIIGGILAIFIFYAIPYFRITPKTNLLIDVSLVAILIMAWRRFFWIFASKASKIKILFSGATEEIENFIKLLERNPQLGYEPTIVLENVDNNFINLIEEKRIQLIIASRNIMENKNSAKIFYEALPLGVSFVDFPTFYETVIEKIPVSIINESWFLINLVELNKQVYEIFKRFFDIIFSILLGIITMIISPLIYFLIKIESQGPIFIFQKRVGKNGKIFEVIKFRSMYALTADGSAEENGAEWAKEKDKRITKVGSILRKTRIDEFPQLWNVLKGEMSFIGPRPERQEFVNELEKQIPHYAMRHLVKPGLSGWAQIKLPHGGIGENAMEKLQHDLFYVKNRSFILDIAIILRTLAIVINREGR